MAIDPFVQQSSWRVSDKVRYSPDEARLIWSRPFREAPWDLDEHDALNDFVKLAAAPFDSDALLRFGRLYGPLLLCEHGLPRTHLKVQSTAEADEDTVMSHGIRHAYQRPQIIEDVAVWRRYIAQADAMQRIADALRTGAAPPLVLWAELRPLLPPVVGRLMESDQPIEVQRRALAVAVQKWLDWGDVGATCTWEADPKGKSPETLRLRIGASSLFGSMALSLALTIAKPPGSVTCANCGRYFVPRRARKPYQRAWCDDDDCQLEKGRQHLRDFRARNTVQDAAESQG